MDIESNAIKIPWLLVCVVVAYWGFTVEGEQRIIPVLALCVLTFPVGILFYGTVSIVSMLIIQSNPGAGADDSIVNNIIVYITPILFGYLQWFVVLPKIVKKFKSGDRSFLLIIILGALFIVAGLYLFYKSVVPDFG